MSISLTKASRSDLDELLALLAVVNLPAEGVVEHIGNFWIARNASNQLIGCAGLERYGRLGLLRSVAVSPGNQNTGLGSKITTALLDDAAKAGIEEVVLLTTTARDFFASRFGFREANRESFDEQLARSPEWRLPRCASAVCMSCEVSPAE
jgi:N-acetylglutamate synthase-like GNAT family acetyltransferase